MSQVYRITVQKMNADGSPGELVEILEAERESWTDVFTFADDYRAEVTAKEEAQVGEPERDETSGCCPNCERPNQFGELCRSCEEDMDQMQREREADEAAQHFQDEGEARAHLHGAWG